MNKIVQIVIIVLLFAFLACIRAFETKLFYDPLLHFFKRDYLYGNLPDFEISKLMLHTAFRFLLNTVISLAILYIAFFDKGVLKFSFYLYAFVFAVLMIWMYIFILQANENSNFQILFYVRRFLIQPLLVLLLLPAFYYHKRFRSS